jgi:hypothetical protein
MSSGNACWIWSKRGCSRGSFPACWRRPEVDAEPTKRSDSRGGGQNAEQSQQHYIDRDSGTEGSNPAPSSEESAANFARLMLSKLDQFGGASDLAAWTTFKDARRRREKRGAAVLNADRWVAVAI